MKTEKEFLESLKQWLLENSFEELTSSELRQQVLVKINNYQQYDPTKESVFFTLSLTPQKELKPELKIKPTGRDYGLLFE